MLTLSQKSGVNSIFVVDDVVANDKFMKDLYRSAGSRTGKKTIVMTTEKCKYYWDEFKFKEYNCIIVTKTIDVVYELVKYGIPMTDINIGGIAQKDPNKDILVTKSVYTNKEDAMKLKELKDNYGVENIYFQATPSASSTSLESVLTKF